MTRERLLAQGVGGVSELALGVAGVLAPEPGTTIGGGVLIVHSIDELQAALRALRSGKDTRTIKNIVVVNSATALGADERTAQYIGVGAEISFGIAAPLSLQRQITKGKKLIHVVDDVEANRVVALSPDGKGDSLLPVSSLNKKQRAIHGRLTKSGEIAKFRKKEISMTDLREIGRVTGDEYSVYTLGGRRTVIRGYGNEIRVTESIADELFAGRLGRWSGHTHPPGYGINASTVDRSFLPIGQERSSLWGDGGRRLFYRTPQQDDIYQNELLRKQMRDYYEQQQ